MDKVIGVEARGFILAAPVAVRVGAGFVPVRKAGKLPRNVTSESYDLEYGVDSLEIHQDAVAAGERGTDHRRRPGHGGDGGRHRPARRPWALTWPGSAASSSLAFLNGRGSSMTSTLFRFLAMSRETS